MVLWLLTTPVQFWVGGQFHLAFLRELRHRSTSMNTLVSIGTNAAYFFSVAVILWPHAFMAAGAMPYFETSAADDRAGLLGRWLEARARGGPPKRSAGSWPCGPGARASPARRREATCRSAEVVPAT